MSTSLLALLTQRCSLSPNSVAFRHRSLGLWNEISWSDYANSVAAAAEGFRALGVHMGDRVAVISEDHPTWMYAALAAQAVGAVSVGLHPDTSPEYLTEMLSQLNVAVAVVGNQEQLDKLLDPRNAGLLPSLQHVVVVNTRGVRELDTAGISTIPGVTTWEKMTRVDTTQPTANLAGDLDPTSTALAQVGLDKSITLYTHNELAELAAVAKSEFYAGARNETLAVSSFATIGSLLVDVLAPLVAGTTVNIGQGGASTLRELSQVRPTVLAGSTSLLERIKDDADRKAAGTKSIKKAAYAAALRRGASRAASKIPRRTNAPVLLIVSSILVGALLALGGRPGASKPIERLAPSLLVLFVFIAVVVLGGFGASRAVRNRYGIGRLRTLSTGGEAIPEDLEHWFWCIGVPVSSSNDEIERVLSRVHPAKEKAQVIND